MPIDYEAQLKIVSLEQHITELHQELREVERHSAEELTMGMERCEEVLRLREAAEEDRVMQLERLLRSKMAEHEASEQEAERTSVQLAISERKRQDAEAASKELRADVSRLRDEMRQAAKAANVRIQELTSELGEKTTECSMQDLVARWDRVVEQHSTLQTNAIKHQVEALRLRAALSTELAEERRKEQSCRHELVQLRGAMAAELAEERRNEQSCRHEIAQMRNALTCEVAEERRKDLGCRQELAELRVKLAMMQEEINKLQDVNQEQARMLKDKDVKLQQAEDEIQRLEDSQKHDAVELQRRHDTHRKELEKQFEEKSILQDARNENTRVIKEMDATLQSKSDEIAKLTSELDKLRTTTLEDALDNDNSWARRAVVRLPHAGRGSIVEIKERAPVALGGMLQTIFFFGQMPQDVVLQMLDCMEKVLASKGDVIEQGGSVFLVEDGSLQEVSQESIRNVYRSNIFGERPLVWGRIPSTVTVVSDTAVLWRITYTEVDRLASRRRMEHHFSHFAKEDIDKIASSAQLLFCYSGEDVPLQRSSKCYLIESGKFVGRSGGKVETLFHGDIIGIEDHSTATVTAQSARCGVWAIDRGTLKRSAAYAGGRLMPHGSSLAAPSSAPATSADVPWVTAVRSQREAYGKHRPATFGGADHRENTSAPYKHSWGAGDTWVEDGEGAAERKGRAQTMPGFWADVSPATTTPTEKDVDAVSVSSSIVVGGAPTFRHARPPAMTSDSGSSWH